MRRIASMMAVVVVAGTLCTSAFAQDAAPQPSSGETGVRAPHGLMDTSPQDRSNQLSFWLGLPFAYGFGLDVGVRFSIPLVKNGFIPRLNNSFELEFGGDLAYYLGYYTYSVIIPYVEAAVRWTFYIVPKFAAYAKVGLGLGYAITAYSGFTPFYLSIPFSVGILYWITPSFALRAEAGGGYDYYGVRIGIGFDL